MTKSEILFYYESRQNPNGDPDAENQPRIMYDETIMVTDVRIKRTIRDYAKTKLGVKLFVDYDDNGNAVKADDRAKSITNKDKHGSYIKGLLNKTFDVPLFGGLVTIRGKAKSKDKGDYQKLTGPVQFSLGRSVNKVNLIQPSITSRFIGDEKTTKGTMGRFYSVEYALIKISGAINPINLGKYLEDDDIKEKFEGYVNKLPILLWDGTNELITRSKYPQKSILFIQIDYKDVIYNDLAELIDENEKLKGKPKSICDKPFVFTTLASTINQRKKNIEKIIIKHSDAVNINDLKSKLDSDITVKIL